MWAAWAKHKYDKCARLQILASESIELVLRQGGEKLRIVRFECPNLHGRFLGSKCSKRWFHSCKLNYINWEWLSSFLGVAHNRRTLQQKLFPFTVCQGSLRFRATVNQSHSQAVSCLVLHCFGNKERSAANMTGLNFSKSMFCNRLADGQLETDFLLYIMHARHIICVSYFCIVQSHLYQFFIYIYVDTNIHK